MTRRMIVSLLASVLWGGTLFTGCTAVVDFPGGIVDVSRNGVLVDVLGLLVSVTPEQVLVDLPGIEVHISD